MKDISVSPLELIKDPQKDSIRLSLFPSLDYKDLYNSLVKLLEIASSVQYGSYGNFLN